MKDLLKAPKPFIAVTVIFFCLGLTELITLAKDQHLDVFSTTMLAIAIGLANLHKWSFKALKIFAVLYTLINVPFLILGALGHSGDPARANLFGFDLSISYWLYFLVMSLFIGLQLYVAFWGIKKVQARPMNIDVKL